jgi:DNA repair protein RecO (recombination protein O)
LYKKSPAICLKKTNYTQKDSLVTCFTAKFGKDDFLARGLRKPKAKLKSALFPLRGVKLTFVKGKQFPVITGAEIRLELEALEESFNYHTLGLFWAEIIDLAFVEPEPHSEFFDNFLQALQILNQEAKKGGVISQKATVLSIWLIVKLLSTTGYEIQLARCVSCNKKIAAENKHTFDPLRGGILCKNCREDKEGQISEASRKYLMELKKAKEPSFELPPKEQLQEIKTVSFSFLYHQLDQRPSTHKLVNW